MLPLSKSPFITPSSGWHSRHGYKNQPAVTVGRRIIEKCAEKIIFFCEKIFFSAGFQKSLSQ